MARQFFEEEAGLLDIESLRTGDHGYAPELDELPPANKILFETGTAVAAALAAGLLVEAVLQYTLFR